VVILQFNRLIRNKWIWGVFAVAISAFFAFDFLIADLRGGGERSSGEAGMLGDRELPMSEFRALVDDARGIGRQRDSSLSNAEANRIAWEAAAALDVAKNLRLTATDDEVRQAVLREFRDPSTGAFNMTVYENVLRENGLTPELFEAYMKRRISLMKVRGVVLGSARWVAPSELEGALNDVTDKLTVKVAYFVNKDSSKVTIDDKGLEEYYKENTNSIALPETMTVRYVKYQADTPERLAQFKPTDDELHDHYDATSSRFETSTTNGVVTKKFEEVKGILEKELQLIASLEAYRTNLLFRAYPPDAPVDEKGSRLDKIAAEDKAKVLVSPRFSASGEFVSGFMQRPETFAAGCPGFAAAAAELDAESADLRYGVVAGTNAVYVLERVASKDDAAHVPPFAEAKEIIRPRALAAARAKAFKEEVEKKRALAAAELAKGKPFDAKTLAADNVTTSMTFTVMSAGFGAFPDSRQIAPAAMKLENGKISDFIVTANPNRGLLVYMEKRTPGDAAEAQMMRSQMRDQLAGAVGAALGEDWSKWNLERIGYQANSSTSPKAFDESSLPED
jgi:hypothetical protein